MAKNVTLSQGKIALVDESDFDRVSQFKWHFERGYGVRTEYIKGSGYPGKNKKIYLHRFIMQAEKGVEVDHINGNRSDCQRVNLRLCSHKENTQNTLLRADNKSGFKGVCWITAKKRWRSECNSKHIGYFSTKEEAAAAYNDKAQQFYGKFARLNQL